MSKYNKEPTTSPEGESEASPWDDVADYAPDYLEAPDREKTAS